MGNCPSTVATPRSRLASCMSHIGERFADTLYWGIDRVIFLAVSRCLLAAQLCTLLLFAIAITGAFALQFMIQYTLAMFAFWTEKASSIQEVWFLVYLFLSGAIAPLELFPPAIRTIAFWTPFPYILNFPASILTG